MTERKEIATTEKHEELPSLLNIIASASTNPNVDVGKLEKLIELQERVDDRQAKRDFDDALSQMRPEIPVIRPIKEGHNIKYAPWDYIDALITPILVRHGFTLTFEIGHEGDKITVTAILARGGFERTSTIPLPPETSGSKNNVQALGSSISYGKRYTGCSILNLTVQGEDTDGHVPVNDTAGWFAKIDECNSLTELYALRTAVQDSTFADKKYRSSVINKLISKKDELEKQNAQ